MGDQQSLGPFCSEDCFLRRIAKKRHVARDGTVSPEVFDVTDADDTLSFTFQDDNLKTEEGLDRYQRETAFPSGARLGICWLSYDDLTVSLDPPLPPRHEPDPEDEKYGHLHCVTDCPKSYVRMVQMAKLATDNGVVRHFDPHRKRRTQ